MPRYLKLKYTNANLQYISCIKSKLLGIILDSEVKFEEQTYKIW